MSSFEECWMFPGELKQSLGASSFDVNTTQDCFRTGRARLEAVFYEGEGLNRKVIARRTAMRLISKKTGKPYEVVSRKPESQPAARHPTAPASYTLDDVLVDRSAPSGL